MEKKSKQLFDKMMQADHEGVVKLLKSGANPNVKNQYNEYLLEQACWYGMGFMVQVLLEHGANPDIDDGSPLLSTVRTHNDAEEILESLMEFKVNVNQLYPTKYEDEANGTALMIAIKNGKLKLAEMLIEAGTDLSIEDDDGYSALDWAKETGAKSLVKKIAGMQGKKLRKKDIPENETFIENAYQGSFSPRPNKHSSGISEIDKVYTKNRLPGCANPPVHLASIDLSLFKELPDTMKKLGKLPVVFHNCECEEWDQYNFKIEMDNRLTPIDKMTKNTCLPEHYRGSKKAYGISFSKLEKGKKGKSIVVGGLPHWVQATAAWPDCPECGKRSFFITFINQFDAPPDAKGRGNHLNVFVCPACKVQTIVRQST